MPRNEDLDLILAREDISPLLRQRLNLYQDPEDVDTPDAPEHAETALVEQASWDAYAKRQDALLKANPQEAVRLESLEHADAPQARAVGGPFDGTLIRIPNLRATEVMLPAAFGAGDLGGMVVYRRKLALPGEPVVFEYAGQPDQTEAIEEEMRSREEATS